MTREELKSLLLELAEQEPEFMNTLVGEIVKDNLWIDSKDVGDYYKPEKTYVLQWKDSEYGYEEFSRAY